jgi:hypothetical protein
MRPVRLRLPLLVYLSAFALSFLAVVALIIVSWWEAAQQPRHHLRWTAIAKSKITQGSQLTEAQLQWRFVKLPEDFGFIASAKAALGRYARRTIDEGSPLCPEDLDDLPPTDVPTGGAVVPVQVKSDLAGSLKPGMRLAFVQEKEILPSIETLASSKDGRGFFLLALGASPSDTKVTLLTIQVEASGLALVPKLGTGEWRPVILDSAK